MIKLLFYFTHPSAITWTWDQHRKTLERDSMWLQYLTTVYRINSIVYSFRQSPIQGLTNPKPIYWLLIKIGLLLGLNMFNHNTLGPRCLRLNTFQIVSAANNFRKHLRRFDWLFDMEKNLKHNQVFLNLKG